MLGARGLEQGLDDALKEGRVEDDDDQGDGPDQPSQPTRTDKLIHPGAVAGQPGRLTTANGS